MSKWRKQEIIDYLKEKDIPFPPKAKRPELYKILKLNNSFNYKVDQMIINKGHISLRLPPYMCEVSYL